MILFLFAVALLPALGGAARAQGEVDAIPEMMLRTGVEDGEKLVIATVTRRGKPLEDILVAFYVQRTFGLLELGEEGTLDDGTAAVPFPEGLPAEADGKLEMIARITDPPEYASIRVTQRMDGGMPRKPAHEDSFPRALWAPHAPFPLVFTFALLLGVVWCIYAYVARQLFKIRAIGGKES